LQVFDLKIILVTDNICPSSAKSTWHLQKSDKGENVISAWLKLFIAQARE